MSRHVWTNDTDFIVAETRDEAWSILSAHYGASPDDFEKDDLRIVTDADFWVGFEDIEGANSMVEDLMRAGPIPESVAGHANPISIAKDAEGPWPFHVVADMAIWVQLSGRYLACTEY